MENTKDLLQIKIDENREKLSKESRMAIDSIDWKSIIIGMQGKYTYDQLEELSTETELLLSGTITTEKYEEELEKRMLIKKEEVDLLLNEMDKIIFKKIQENLEKEINKEIEIPLPPYALNKEEVPQAPKTEEGIYENSGIEIMPEEILPNTEAKEGESRKESVTDGKEDIKKEEVIFTESGIAVVEDTPVKEEAVIVPDTAMEKAMLDSVEHPENITKNILMNKLQGSSVSNSVVTDYSLPKMNTSSTPNPVSSKI